MFLRNRGGLVLCNITFLRGRGGIAFWNFTFLWGKGGLDAVELYIFAG